MLYQSMYLEEYQWYDWNLIIASKFSEIQFKQIISSKLNKNTFETHTLYAEVC